MSVATAAGDAQCQLLTLPQVRDRHKLPWFC